MFEDLRIQVYKANIEVVKRGLVVYTWGNVSGIDRDRGIVIIKPSGMDYSEMKPEDMVMVDITTGKKVSGNLKPSSDTDTHLEIYRRYEEISAIVHVHSANAVAFAQAGAAIPVLGTTHADYFCGDIPCTRDLRESEVNDKYEKNTGKVIVEMLDELKISPMKIPGILVKSHGPFAWGNDPMNAVHNCVILEICAEMALKTLTLNKNAQIPQYLLNKHYERKHGKNAYYGQW